MEILLWVGAGLLGTYLLWLNNQYTFRFPERCPTPKAIVIMLLVSPAGPFFLLLAAIFWFIEWMERRPRKNSWWTRPICGPRQ